MATLVKISGNSDGVGDVIFVHGLNGDWKETWHPAGCPNAFWPNWLGEDFPDVRIWSLDYDASATTWTGKTMPLVDYARHTIALLESNGIGRKGIVFITHSFGGLLAKQVLHVADTQNNPDWFGIRDSIRGFVFLATPHSGSWSATMASFLHCVARTTVTVKELEAHDPHLRDLNEWFRGNFNRLGLRAEVFREQYKIRNLQLIVNASSADPGIAEVRVTPMDDDHVSICKPKSKETMLYMRTRTFIERCLCPDPRSARPVTQ